MSIVPSSGVVNTQVTINGSNFSTILTENKVTFNGKEAIITTASATELTATVPLASATGPVNVIVNGLASANQPLFTVEVSPEVSTISPSSGYAKSSVIITGNNFSTVTAENKVTFNGKDAVVTLATTTQLVVNAPSPVETGLVIVTVNGKVATNQPTFTVETVDKIRLAIVTSLTRYDAAVANSWVNITAAEYNNLLIVVNGSARYGVPEIVMATETENGWSADYTVGGNKNAVLIPSSGYIIAWAVRTGAGISSSIDSKLKVSTSQNTGYVDYGNPLPAIGNIAANSRVYFVMKTPETPTAASPSYTAVYNAGIHFLGNRTSAGAGPEHYKPGDSPTLETLFGSDSFSQTICTQIKQW
jgi:hypothetical protein